MSMLGLHVCVCVGGSVSHVFCHDRCSSLSYSVGKDQDSQQDGQLCVASCIGKGSSPPALREVTQEVSRALGKHGLGLRN